jgi:transposase
MSGPATQPTYEQLAELVAELGGQNLALRRRIEQLEAQLRSGPPSGRPPLPPFVKPVVVPKKKGRGPGRRAGHEPALRAAPPAIDQTIDVPLAGAADGGGGCRCPDCQGELTDLRDHERIVEDIVPAKVITTCYRTRSGRCEHCHKRVESRHADQPPAADVPHGQIGLNALAVAAVLKHDAGLPYRKVTRVLNDLCGLSVSAGALPKQVRRMAGWLGEPYDQIKVRIRASPVVHADETGARVDGKNFWLWVATTPTHTLFHLDPSRGGHVPLALLGPDFAGHLVTDFYSAYNRLPYRKQKCLVHLLREIRQTADRNPAFATSVFAVRLKRLTTDLLTLKRRWDDFDDATYTRRACRLEDRLDQLGKTVSADRDVNRLAKRVRTHARHLTAFLLVKDLPGENNAAERAIRPAVVIRKISGGHRGRTTAEASAVITSVLRTARQQGRHLIETMKHLFRCHLAGTPADLLTATSG